MNATETLFRELVSMWRPIPPQRLSAWAEENIHLPAGLSAVPGRLALWAYQRDILDAVLDPRNERISVLKAARTGYSTLLAAITGYYSVVEPSSILAVLPVDDDARSFMVQQIESVFAVSPPLADVLGGPESGKTSRNTMLFRRYMGGSLRVVSARSPRNLRAHSASILLLDEIDGYEITGEGSPVALAERRTASFGDRRIIAGSTPTTSDSAIAARYEESDKRVFECPCPSCGAFAELRWADIHWPEGRPEEAAWCCPSCGVLHSDADHKADMVAAGRWRATAPFKGHAGFKLSALVSLFPACAWPALAAEFVAAKRNPHLLRPWINTVLGEVLKTEEDDPIQAAELMALAEPMSLDAIPAEVLVLTSGVDCQGDRLEIVTIGHTREDDWLILSHDVLIGDPLADAVWADLHDLLGEKYPHPLGRKIGRDATVIDAGDGRMMDRVLAFCSGNRDLRLIPGKGAPGLGRPSLTPTASRRARALQIVGVDGIKSRVFDRLSQRSGIRFSDQLGESFYLQLVSERSVVRYVRGRPERRFERIPGRLAEALDASVYAIAATAAVAIDPVRRSEELKGHPVTPVIPVVIRSAWLDKGRYY
jgi:phage terminase large subunit GpA-like protein